MLPAALIGDDRRDGDGQRKEEDADDLIDQEIMPRIAELRRPMVQREDGHQIEKNEGRERARRPDEEAPRMLRDHAHRGDAHALFSLERLLEIGGLMDIEPDPEADEDEEGARDEGDTPSEAKELRLVEEDIDEDEGARR